MAEQFFPIFKFVKRSSTENIPKSSANSSSENAGEKASEKDNENDAPRTKPKLHCMMCYEESVLIPEKTGTDNDNEYIFRSSNLFETCLKMLDIQLIEQMRWNFEHEVLPFCKECLSVIEKLFKLYTQLKFVKDQIARTLLLIKVGIMKSNDLYSKRMAVQVPTEEKRRVVGPASNSEKVDYFRKLAIRDFDPNVQLWRSDVVIQSQVDGQPIPSRVTLSDSKNNPVCSVVEKISTSRRNNCFQKLALTILNKKETSPHATCDLTKTKVPDQYSGPKLASLAKENKPPHIITSTFVKKVNNDVELDVSKHETIREKISPRIKNNVGSKRCRYSHRNVSIRNKPNVDDFVVILNVEKTSHLEAKKNFTRIGSNFWKCKLCQHRLARSSNSRRNNKGIPNFSRHINQVHRKLKPYQCGLCRNLYTNITSCRSHVQNDHLTSISNNVPSSKSVKTNNPSPTVIHSGVNKDRPAKFSRLRQRIRTIGRVGSEAKVKRIKIGRDRQAKDYKIFFEEKGLYHACKLCTSRIFSAGSLKRHVVTQHGSLSKLMCAVCSKIFPLDIDRQRHMKNEHLAVNNHCAFPAAENANVVPELSNDCGSKNLNINNSDVVGDDLCHNQSNICDESLISSNALQPQEKKKSAEESISNHRSSPKNKKIKTYPPHIERGITTENTGAQNWAQYAYTLKSGKVNVCKTCGKKFNKRSFLYRHIIEVHSVAGLGYQCKYCKRRYHAKSDCALHIRVQHYMEKPYNCVHCESRFNSCQSRNSHQRNCDVQKNQST